MSIFVNEKLWRQSCDKPAKKAPEPLPEAKDDLEGKTLNELRALAQDASISPWGKSKAELLEVLRGA